MTEPIPNATSADERVQLLTLLGRHKAAGDGFGRLVTFLASDQSEGFYRAPFHQRSDSRFAVPGGLFAATVEGYKALLYLHRTANELYTETNVDRLVMCYLLIMLARWGDLQAGNAMYTKGGTPPAASMATLTVVNAMAFDVKLFAAEVQAITKHFASYSEMGHLYEPFNTEWWVLHQTMEFLLIASKA